MAAVVVKIVERASLGAGFRGGGPRGLDDLVQRSPYLLLRLDRAVNPTFHLGLAEWFDQRYPGKFSFGVMSRADWPDARLAERLQSSLGPLRRGVSDGYYLLEGGFVVGYHGSQFRPVSVTYASEPGEAALRAELARHPASAGVGAHDREPLAQLVCYFDPLVERKVRAASSEGAPRSAREAPPPPSGLSGPDPYQVLGIAPDATDDQVKAAYKAQLKLNHPDKVAHLSPALQQFAQAQTLAINQAYASIGARRGWSG
ncbi:MAG: J domain-containing protein [Myxococcota bacterium]